MMDEHAVEPAAEETDSLEQGRRRPAAWRHLGFRQLIRAWVFTNVADSILFLMLAVWVKDLTGSDSAAAMVMVAVGAPALVAPFLGQLADRMSRRLLMVITNILMTVAIASLLLVESTDLLWLIYVVTFLYGCMGYVTSAAGSGLLRDLLADDELASGNAILSTIDQAFRLVGPLVGAGLYVFAGPHSLVAVTAVCFAVSAFLLTRVSASETKLVKDEGSSYWTDLSAGARHLIRTPMLGVLTLALAIGFGATGMINAAVFPAMEQGFGVEAAMLGVFVSVQGAFAVVGGVTSARVIRAVGEWRAIAFGITLLALAILPIAGPYIVGGFVAMALVGLGIPWVIVAYSTMRQRLTPADLQGRTAVAAAMALNLPQTLTTMGAAAVLGIIDYRILVLATFAVVALVAIGLLLRRPPVVEEAEAS